MPSVLTLPGSPAADLRVSMFAVISLPPVLACVRTAGANPGAPAVAAGAPLSGRLADGVPTRPSPHERPCCRNAQRDLNAVDLAAHQGFAIRAAWAAASMTTTGMIPTAPSASIGSTAVACPSARTSVLTRTPVAGSRAGNPAAYCPGERRPPAPRPRGLRPGWHGRWHRALRPRRSRGRRCRAGL